MRPVGRVDHETVDEMGLEAVLALKRERDALRAEVEHLKQRLEQECRAGCESRAKLKGIVRSVDKIPSKLVVDKEDTPLGTLYRARWNP